jgi:SNF2 family DNA or RNA helicase
VSSPLQIRILRRKQSPEEYWLYKAGLEWSLIDPIVINDRDDLKSEYRWKDHVEPFNHQVTNLITFCRRLPITLLADDVGLGKTISAGLIMSELIARSRISKTLIVCPKLLGPQWEEELSTKFAISAKVAIGKELVKIDPEEHGAIITTYRSAQLYLDKLPQDRFQMLVLDEAHKLRNLYGTEKPPKVALCFRKALEERRFQYVLMLTATPIQNRLWDLYSLIDLLTVAQGHENPLGSEGMFARKFIADKPKQARQLKSESQSEFRAIVSGYISRTRRDDAKLYFPERVVQMHAVDPTEAELRLIKVISEEIKNLNRLTQISILQALVSSPDALKTQLDNMAKSGSVPQSLASDVRDIVTKMPISAKLRGLEELINRLKQENPERWRLVVFTGRLETQVTIQNFLEEKGLKVGIINGISGAHNQETIKGFKSNPPTCRIIVSTEAGSEGVNLQVANVFRAISF